MSSGRNVIYSIGEGDDDDKDVVTPSTGRGTMEELRHTLEYLSILQFGRSLVGLHEWQLPNQLCMSCGGLFLDVERAFEHPGTLSCRRVSARYHGQKVYSYPEGGPVPENYRGITSRYDLCSIATLGYLRYRRSRGQGESLLCMVIMRYMRRTGEQQDSLRHGDYLEKTKQPLYFFTPRCK